MSGVQVFEGDGRPNPMDPPPPYHDWAAKENEVARAEGYMHFVAGIYDNLKGDLNKLIVDLEACRDFMTTYNSLVDLKISAVADKLRLVHAELASGPYGHAKLACEERLRLAIEHLEAAVKRVENKP